LLGIIRAANPSGDGLTLTVEFINKTVGNITLNKEEREGLRKFEQIKSIKDLVGTMFNFSPDGLPVSFMGWSQIETKKIAIDVSEPRELDGIQFAYRTNLDSGDVVFYSFHGKSIGIERKSIANLLSDMALLGKTHSEGHSINEQLDLLINTYDIPIILIERHPTVFIDSDGLLQSTYKGNKPPWVGIPWDYVANYLMEWQLAGLFVDVTENLRHTIQRIDGLYKWFSKQEHTAISKRARYIVSDGGAVKGLNLLLGLDGYGEDTSRRVLSQTKTARSYFNMGIIDRMVLGGIGEKRAREVDVALDEEYQEREKGKV
jgi:ERCC4-type nuclease